MLGRYHIEITKKSLGSFFSPASLREIARANVGQDSLGSLFGVQAHRHVCDCSVADSLAYIEEEHTNLAALTLTTGAEGKQRAALGRLLHTVQDFYAHTNYVALWLSARGDTDSLDDATVDGLDPYILAHPRLQTAQWLTWRDPFYYVPVMGKVLRRFHLPPASHEAIHLDSPSRGDAFYLAMAIARQRSRREYARAVAAIRERGGHAAVARFHGDAAYLPQAALLEA